MFRFQKNDRYTSIAIYAFIILALTVVAVVIGINLPYIYAEFVSLLDILSCVIIGIIIAYICNPLLRFAEKFLFRRLKKRSRRFTRILALILTYLTVTAIFAVLLLMIVPQIVTNYQDLAEGLARYTHLLFVRINELLRNIPGVEWGVQDAGAVETDTISDILNKILSFFGGQIAAISVRIFAMLGSTLVGIVLSAYFLYYKDQIIARLKKITLALFPRIVYTKAAELLRFSDHAFGRFMVGKFFESFIIGVIAIAALAIFGIPYFPLIAAIISITILIPIFGPIIGAIPSFLIILIVDPLKALWFLLIALGLQQLDANFIGPKIVGTATGLSSVWVITAILLMGAYFGPIGWFIGVPLFSVLYRVIGDFANRRLKKKKYPVALSYYEENTIATISGDILPPGEALPLPSDTDEQTSETDEHVTDDGGPDAPDAPESGKEDERHEEVDE